MRIAVSIACLFGLVLCTNSPTQSTSTPSTPTPSAPTSGEREDINEEQMEALFNLLFRFPQGNTFVFGFRSAPNPRPSPAEPWVVTYMNRILEVAESPESVLTDPSVKQAVRRIGREIYASRGHQGMVAVCENNRD
jgi:hypothetical protein